MSQRPFDIEFVTKLTLTNMRRDVDLSISKTFARIPEFKDNPEKSQEVFLTLMRLHTIRAQIDAITFK